MTKEEKEMRRQEKRNREGKVGLGKMLLWNSSSCSVALSALILGYVSFYCTDVLKMDPLSCRHTVHGQQNR